MKYNGYALTTVERELRGLIRRNFNVISGSVSTIEHFNTGENELVWRFTNDLEHIFLFHLKDEEFKMKARIGQVHDEDMVETFVEHEDSCPLAEIDERVKNFAKFVTEMNHELELKFFFCPIRNIRPLEARYA